MLHSRLARCAVAGALTLGPIVAVVGTGASPAFAFAGIKCHVLTGNISTTVTLSSCNGNTGGGTIAEPTSTLISGGTITWLNSDTTTFGTPTLTAIAQSSSTYTCLKNSSTSEESATGPVTADTTGSAPVPGTYKLSVCINSKSGAITLAPKTLGNPVLKPAKIG